MDVVVWLRSLGLEQYEAAFREDEITEDDARPGKTPGVAGDLEDAGADEDAEQRGVRLDRAEVAAEVVGHGGTR